MYAFHEVFDGGGWDFHGSEFFNVVFMYGSSYTCRDRNEGVCLPPPILYGGN